MVLRIDADGGVVVLPWPGEDAGRRQVVRMAVGGLVDAAVYDRRAQFHMQVNGQAERLPMNLAVWVLASVWRGMEIPYGFYGPVVVTGPQMGALDEAVAQEVQAVCEAVGEVRQEWVTRQPAGEWQARAELLAAARHRLAALA